MRKLKNYTEGEALEIIAEVTKKLAPNFTFGYYDIDDLIQEGQILALKIIDNGTYDESRPLKNFLYVYLRSRYINLRRDKYFRHTPPCKACPLNDPKLLCSTNGCSGFADKMECDKYNMWVTLNNAKRNLVDPIDIDNVDDDVESGMRENGYLLEGQEGNEIAAYIDNYLPMDMRTDYLKMISNYGVKHTHKVKISSDRVKEIQAAVSGILVSYYDQETW